MKTQNPKLWRVSTENDRHYVMVDGSVVAKVYLNDGSAQRIADCMNACAGVGQEVLESAAAAGLVARTVFEEMRQTQKQRDDAFDLLARILDGDVGRHIFAKLATGQATETETEDGKTWLAARDFVERGFSVSTQEAEGAQE